MLLRNFAFLVMLVAANATTKPEQCCATPVESFIMREFSGPCSCQTLNQKWRRYVDWIEINGGYVHPWIEFGYVSDFKHDEFSMYSHERGLFVNIPQGDAVALPAMALLLQVPFSIAFSELLIAKYIRNTHSRHRLRDSMFPKADHFLPASFPDVNEFRRRTGQTALHAWLALGMAWLQDNTRELLPWFALLPFADYLPINWDGAQREELLAGTKALPLVRGLQAQFDAVRPYIDMLGLSETKVKESFSMIISRAFTMDLSALGGLEMSPVIPCGIDYPNHDIQIMYGLHYDPSFGAVPANAEIITEIVRIRENMATPTVTNVDYASGFLFVAHEFANASEVLINYGQHQTSAQRLSRQGFIDAVHPFDRYGLFLDVPAQKEDPLSDTKRRYFEGVWSEEEIECYLPPLEMEIHYGQDTIEIDSYLFRYLRLAYLPAQYFDSFTISSILNDFEYSYIETVIDPLVLHTVHGICRQQMQKFGTTSLEDQLQQKRVEQERKQIFQQLKRNKNRNKTETHQLRKQLSLLDIEMTALKYRTREREFLHNCTVVRLEPDAEYLEELM